MPHTYASEPENSCDCITLLTSALEQENTTTPPDSNHQEKQSRVEQRAFLIAQSGEQAECSCVNNRLAFSQNSPAPGSKSITAFWDDAVKSDCWGFFFLFIYLFICWFPVAATAGEADLDSSRENVKPCSVGNEHTHQSLIIKLENKTSLEPKSVEHGVWCCSLALMGPWGPISPLFPLLFCADVAVLKALC